MIETRYQHVKHSIRNRDSALLGMKGIMAKPAKKIGGSRAESIARRSKSNQEEGNFLRGEPRPHFYTKSQYPVLENTYRGHGFPVSLTSSAFTA